VYFAYLKLKVILKNLLKERKEKKTKIQEELKNSKNSKLDIKRLKIQKTHNKILK
jgi:hypothetical protein